MDFPHSSVVKSADCDLKAQTLDVTFRTGRRYTYFDVPEEVFGASVTAPSAGEYFNTHNRDRYSCREHP